MTISILGSGWLGNPLAKHLAQTRHQVNISTTSEAKLISLQAPGITPFLINLAHPDDNTDAFLDTDILISAIPSKDVGAFGRFIERLHRSHRPHRPNILFVSSTSVYPAHNQIAREDDPLPPSPLAEIESLFAAHNATILRFGGLIGGTRHPGRFFRPGRVLRNPHHPVNLIHQDDCIGIIDAIITQNAWGEIFNGCADTHPDKATFYSEACKAYGNPPPEIDASDPSPYKTVSNDKVKQRLGYTFNVPDPLAILNDPEKFTLIRSE